MKIIFFLAIVAVALSGRLADISDEVNSLKTTWTAQNPTRFQTIEEAKALCKTWLPGHPNYVQLPILKTASKPRWDKDDFDWRKAVPECLPVVTVRDQSACGNGWAFGAVESFNDRMAIQYHDYQRFLSAEDVTSCCSGEGCGSSSGCQGGQPGAALQWMSDVGVVSGGLFSDIGTNNSCLPYSFPPCSHTSTSNSSKYPACPTKDYPTPSCALNCSNTKYPTPYASDKLKGFGAYAVKGGIVNIMGEVGNNGPVTATMTIYEDFLTYKSGVYQHVTGEKIGAQTLEIVGFGVDRGVQGSASSIGIKYWILKNSWNEEWGDKGFINVRKGVDECGIESDISAIYWTRP